MRMTLKKIQDTYKDLGTMNSWTWGENPEEFKQMCAEKLGSVTCYQGETFEVKCCHANKTFWKVFTS